MNERKVFARLTRNGTAMSEAALCGEHFQSERIRESDEWADMAGDAGDRVWVDCTGNPVLSCTVCGHPHPDVGDSTVGAAEILA